LKFCWLSENILSCGMGGAAAVPIYSIAGQGQITGEKLK